MSFYIEPNKVGSLLAQAEAALHFWNSESEKAAITALECNGNGFTITHAQYQFECAQKAEFWAKRIERFTGFTR